MPSLFHSLFHSLRNKYTHTHTFSISFTHTHTRTHTHLPVSLSPSFAHKNFLFIRFKHTHTHTHTAHKQCLTLYRVLWHFSRYSFSFKLPFFSQFLFRFVLFIFFLFFTLQKMLTLFVLQIKERVHHKSRTSELHFSAKFWQNRNELFWKKEKNEKRELNLHCFSKWD
jgi:hypothetical protein